MPPDHVRVCPVCERENPPQRTRCACGALLTGIDFSMRRPPPAEPRAADAGEPEPAADAAAAVRAADADAAAAVPAPEADTAAAEPMAEAAAVAAAAPAQLEPVAPATVCPHPDCGQRNPAGSERCVYCNRPLQALSPAIAGARPLPSALRDAYRTVDVFPATGGEADILLVADAKTGERRVAKLYRRGIAPDFRLLDVLAQAVGDTVVRVLAHGVSDGAAYERTAIALQKSPRLVESRGRFIFAAIAFGNAVTSQGSNSQFLANIRQDIERTFDAVRRFMMIDERRRAAKQGVCYVKLRRGPD